MNNEWSKITFSKNLRHYMNRSGRTQKELAEIAGVSAPTFNEWINAKKFPRIDKIQRLADYFGILKSDLIEEKASEEVKRKIDEATDIIIRMQKDKDFYALVQTLYRLDSGKIAAVKAILDNFAK